MVRGALLGAIAGAAIATLPGGAGVLAAALGAAAGAVVGWRFALHRPGMSLWTLALGVFFVPVVALPVAPGADMAMHTALARGLLDGVLSPAWPGVHVAAYPRGFPALIALLSPVGLARAGLLAWAASYVVFWAGLTAVLEGPLRTPAARTVAAVAVLLSGTPQAYFAWGGNPTALALGLSLFGAAQDGAVPALYFAGAAAVHPMGAVAGLLSLPLRYPKWRPVLAGALGATAVVALLALAGPKLSSHETEWIKAYAAKEEHAGTGVLGDPANVVTLLAAAWLLYKRDFRTVGLAAAGVAGLYASFLLLPHFALYPMRFAPLLLLCVAPLWGRAAAARIPLLAPIALVVALPFNVRWYQTAAPIATFGDLRHIECVQRTVPPGAVIDGAYGDATQWLPALTGHAVTQPHQHVSLFDETDTALQQEPKASWRFLGERLRYPPALGSPSGAPLCDASLYPE